MISKISWLIDILSDFFASRKGLLPIIGTLLILLNFILKFVPGLGWITETDIFLHIGILLAIFGFLLAWAL
jgi:hypothetical protein